MNPLPHPLRGSSVQRLMAAGARTTVRGDGPSAVPADDHLRVIVARVIRTGRGPAGLVGWVRQELTDSPPTDDAVALLADRLVAKLFPAVGQTVGG